MEHLQERSWQYQIRVKNRAEDLEAAGLTEEEVSKLTVKDFTFKHVEDREERRGLQSFIERHEWLGTLSQYTTHWFAAYYKDILAGVVLFNMPNAFSKMLGEDTKYLERLISRGACISWSPRNLASSMIMWAIRWMVQNTDYRLFTAYSDPQAAELGTIYQATNFYYLGQTFGTTTRYINPYTGREVSDRFFRVRSAYVRYAKELGIEFKPEWKSDQKMLWDNIPDDVEKKLRAMSKIKQAEATKIKYPHKHKYAYVLGRDKRETRQLRRKFEERNRIYEYPKEEHRGVHKVRTSLIK